jgi:hypothetical protein
MKERVLISLLAVLSFTACTNSVLSPSSATIYQEPTEAKMFKFNPVMTEVALSTRNDPRYNKMTIKPEDKVWFKGLMYRYWDRQITRSQFVAEGKSRYPDHSYEFSFIANGFQNCSRAP